MKYSERSFKVVAEVTSIQRLIAPIERNGDALPFTYQAVINPIDIAALPKDVQLAIPSVMRMSEYDIQKIVNALNVHTIDEAIAIINRASLEDPCLLAIDIHERFVAETYVSASGRTFHHAETETRPAGSLIYVSEFGASFITPSNLAQTLSYDQTMKVAALSAERRSIASETETTNSRKLLRDRLLARAQKRVVEPIPDPTPDPTPDPDPKKTKAPKP